MPHQVVHASAGTGKTYYLTNRLLRLLLLGVNPGAIVAITFTNKAAAEIQTRVFERAASLLTADDTALEKLFVELKIPGGAARQQCARRLYETLIAAAPPLRVTTFHAFCLDLLRRLPQEAGIAPGFALSENETPWRLRAWEALEREAHTDADTAAAWQRLLVACDGLHNVTDALDAFLRQRADWWAFTEHADDPVNFAGERLRADLALDPAADAALTAPAFTHAIARYAALIARHSTKTLQDHAGTLTRCLAERPDNFFDAVWNVFFTQDDDARAVSPKLLTILTSVEADECLHSRAECLRVLEDVRRARLRAHTWQLSTAWYYAGARLLAHFQALKAADNVLDFADLEWRAYRLLTAADHAEWVQYKLDQRIDHVLIDEFQDTNPTQWQLILPLLTEMTAGDTERVRSILLVGDEKQAIYRFRRAEPALFAAASDWLETQGRAERLTQSASWRSSPAIIDFVNLIFAAPDAPTLLPSFTPHTTQRGELWGRVEMLPLIPQADAITDAPSAGDLRNPLLTPRPIDTDRRYELEAAQLIAAIRGLVGRVAVGADADGDARPLRYGDILLLLRERTNAARYEHALRAAGMPYIGAVKTQLCEQPEVQDILQLLTWLYAPGDAFALATVLRAPLFAASDADLIALRMQAMTSEPWDWERALAQTDAPHLQRAGRLLSHWRARVDTVPVHDLLDAIYHEGNVLARYDSATPPHLRARVRANLNRLLALALEIDSGRYPGVAGFLRQLARLNLTAEPPTQAEDAIRLLTIHGAKGLEAPVVFLLDAARPPQPEKGVRPLIVWPPQAQRPQHFHLVGRADEIDDISERLCATQAQARAQEENNLLYVALTRAQQMLFISGCAPKRGGFWYQLLAERLRAVPMDTSGFMQHGDGAAFSLVYGTVPTCTATPDSVDADTGALDPALTKPIQAHTPATFVAPSASDSDAGSDSSRRRGRALHALLDAYTRTPPVPPEREAMMARFGVTGEELATLISQAERLIAQPALRAWFDPARYDRAENEIPVLYRAAGRDVYGVIDRVVLNGNEIAVIDYKSYAEMDITAITARYAPQLRLYAQGVRLLWPTARVRAFVLLTADASAIEIALDD